MTENNFISLKDLYKKIVANRGLLGLYRGFWVTFNRDFVSCGIYFSTFFSLKDYFEEKKKFTSVNIMLAGGIAGIIMFYNLQKTI